MIREKIVDEVTRILLGPIGGNNEELDKNPLDFYSVGVLFPRVGKSPDICDPIPETLGSDSAEESDEKVINNGDGDLSDDKRVKQRRNVKESDESEDSGEFELTTKFRPSAAGLSVLTLKNANLNIIVNFAVYVKKQIERSIIKDNVTKTVKVSVYNHFLKEFSFASQDGEFDFGTMNHHVDGKIIYILTLTKMRVFRLQPDHIREIKSLK